MATAAQPEHGPHPGRTAIVVFVAAAVLVGGFILFSALRSGDACCPVPGGTPPVTFAQSGLMAQAWVVPQGRVVALVAVHGGTTQTFVPHGSEPAVVVRLDWAHQDGPPADVRFNAVVIDPSGLSAAALVQTGSVDPRISIGWDSRYRDLPARYAWLAAVRDIVPMDGSGSTFATLAVSFPPDMPGPLWIVARFPPNTAIDVAHPVGPPIVGAFLTGADEEIWWAQQLTG